ncbi:alpha/beta hydrolase [Lysinibacillus yapensis]|uniref:Alpha/beta hydrolase n=1 Tax=Ureibacillus yapensis TaxID=2304605 RepID=A0A396SAE1_9BACL|nr:alpha/beta hydrolase [Lysinibacillus yapensis]RHW38294.1 alpha/beta hydrolase [Lysinibacillus yapensis]
MLHYIREGAGDPLVLIHGFLGSKDLFKDVIPDLAKHFDVIAIDLPGHGQSEVEQDTYTVYDYAKAVAQVLQHEYITEAIWLGHSLGGYIVLAALEQNIAPINKAILAYSSDLADTEEQKEKRTEQQQKIAEKGVETFVDEMIGGFFSKENIKPKEEIEIASRIAYQASEKGLILALEAMKTRPEQHGFIEQTSTPILIIEGLQDEVVKPIQTENPIVHKVQTNTGHLGMLENPQKFVEAILDFES